MVSEQQALQVSILATVALAVAGIGFGLYCGSQSIVFDGLFNAIDSSMGALALLVSRLLLKQPGPRFQQGYWHIEPMVLAINASVLVMLCAYALISSTAGMLRGGHGLPFDEALLYALSSGVCSWLMYFYLRRVNRRLQSALLELDIHSWLMSSTISLALLLAFGIGHGLQGGAYEDLMPYVDPLALAVLSMVLAPVPCRTVVSAIRQVLRITPTQLNGEIVDVMQQVSRRYQFERFSHCVIENGRGLFVEIHVLLPAAMDQWTVSELDQVRAEIARGIGREGLNRWLTIGFTRDPRWL